MKFEIWTVLMLIGLKQCSVSLAVPCKNQICKQHEFCETQKGICRQCADFEEDCWLVGKHINNCTAYCQVKACPVTLPPKIEQNEGHYPLVWLYIAYVTLPLSVVLAVACAVLTFKYVVMKQNQLIDKNDQMHGSRSTTETNTSGEDTPCLKDFKEGVPEIHVDNDMKLHPRADPNGFVPPIIQAATANYQETGNMAISGR
ncbi:uncharacterized protein [Mytilus edulis]